MKDKSELAVEGISFWRNCGAASVGEWYTKIWFINSVDKPNFHELAVGLFSYQAGILCD